MVIGDRQCIVSRSGRGGGQEFHKFRAYGGFEPTVRWEKGLFRSMGLFKSEALVAWPERSASETLRGRSGPTTTSQFSRLVCQTRILNGHPHSRTVALLAEHHHFHKIRRMKCRRGGSGLVSAICCTRLAKPRTFSSTPRGNTFKECCTRQGIHIFR